MAGRAQKQVGQLQNPRNPRGKVGGVTLVADPTRKVPTAPKGLTKGAATTWRDFFRSALGGSVDYQSDGPALRRWIRLVNEREILIARFAGECAEGDIQTLMVRGSTGQQVLNPLLRYEERLSREIMAYEDRFGMTPLSRMRLGIAIGQAAESLDGMRKRLDEQAKAAQRPGIPLGEDGVIDLDGLA